MDQKDSIAVFTLRARGVAQGTRADAFDPSQMFEVI